MHSTLAVILAPRPVHPQPSSHAFLSMYDIIDSMKTNHAEHNLFRGLSIALLCVSLAHALLVVRSLVRVYESPELNFRGAFALSDAIFSLTLAVTPMTVVLAFIAFGWTGRRLLYRFHSGAGSFVLVYVLSAGLAFTVTSWFLTGRLLGLAKFPRRSSIEECSPPLLPSSEEDSYRAWSERCQL